VLAANEDVRRRFLGESFELDAATPGAASAPNTRAAVAFAPR
jgi:hypothetical protein